MAIRQFLLIFILVSTSHASSSFNGDWLDYIGITYPDDGEFSEFLDENLHKTVCLHTALDMSMIRNEAYEIIKLVGSLERYLPEYKSVFEKTNDGIELISIVPSLSLPIDGVNAKTFIKFENVKLTFVNGGSGTIIFKLSSAVDIEKIEYEYGVVQYIFTKTKDVNCPE